jgi:hypothetical protein
MRLAEYELAVEKAERLEVTICTDEYGSPLHENVELAAAQRLRKLSVAIRRICWSGSCLDDAQKLAGRADEAARKIEESKGIFGGREPRFPASYQPCAGYIPAID